MTCEDVDDEEGSGSLNGTGLCDWLHRIANECKLAPESGRVLATENVSVFVTAEAAGGPHQCFFEPCPRHGAAVLAIVVQALGSARFWRLASPLPTVCHVASREASKHP